MCASALRAVAITAALALGGCPGHVETDAKKSQIHLDLAIDAFQPDRMNLDVVEAEASKAIAYLPTNEDAYNVRGLAHLKRAMDAKYGLEVAACLTGLDAEAQQQAIDEQFDLAAKDFAHATEVAPDFAEAWFNRGNVAMGQDDAAAAIDFFKRSLENPIRLVDATKARANLGSAYLEAGDAVSAAKELRQALQFQPGNCLGRLWLGRVYFSRQEWDKAGDSLEEIVGDPTCRSVQEAPLYLMKTRLSQGLIADAQRAQAACLAVGRTSCIALECAGALTGADSAGARDGGDQ